MNRIRIDADNLDFKTLNKKIRNAVKNGAEEIELLNVYGQRYIGCGLKANVKIMIHGVPGGDLGAFMDGPEIIVYGDAQDSVGNTMNNGVIVVHGIAGDVIGYSMRGGCIYIEGDVGYRVGIHMKEYGETHPILVIGGGAESFLGEYMAGGRIILLGLNREDEPVGEYLGTGIHGGKIYIRGEVREKHLGKGAKITELTEEDWTELKSILKDYVAETGCKIQPETEFRKTDFIKIVPSTHRPYEHTYILE